MGRNTTSQVRPLRGGVMISNTWRLGGAQLDEEESVGNNSFRDEVESLFSKKLRIGSPRPGVGMLQSLVL